MTENTNDPYLERYYQLRRVALAKGFDLLYSRRRANIVDVLLGDVDCEEGAWTGEERLQVVNASDRVTAWASSFADAATVFQELTDYLETPDPVVRQDAVDFGPHLAGEGKGGGMMKLSEDERNSVIVWNVVVDALLANIEYQRDQVVATFGLDAKIHRGYSRAIVRAAKALAIFVDPRDAHD